MLYSEKVLDHFSNPRNVGEIENADGVGEVGNAKCGDIMKMYIKVDDGIISDVKFKTFGCGAAVATSSMPATGVALPFISYGGTSLTVLMGEIGIVLNISKKVKIN